MKKNLTDSNKENMTPSSYVSSASKIYSYYNENNLKSLRDKKDLLINQMEICDIENFKLLKEKEELSCLAVEKDGLIFREKAELEYMNDILKEKENKRNAIIGSVKCSKREIENEISNGIFNTDITGSGGNKIFIRLQNDYVITGTKDRNDVYFNAFYRSNNINSNHSNDTLDKELNTNPQLIKYFAAYNIV